MPYSVKKLGDLDEESIIFFWDNELIMPIWPNNVFDLSYRSILRSFEIFLLNSGCVEETS